MAIVETILQQSKRLFLGSTTAMLDAQATEDLWTKLIELWEDQTVVIINIKFKHIWNHVDRVIFAWIIGNIIADEIFINHIGSCNISEYDEHPRAWELATLTPTTNSHLLRFRK